MILRFGLDGVPKHTLEAPGRKMKLARIRVRKLERQALRTLEKTEAVRLLLPNA